MTKSHDLSPDPPLQQDHRTRVGLERRERMRERLIEGAVIVFAERGLQGTVIDHVIRQAGVSRGTFYNYFDTIEDVLDAARLALGRELIQLVHGSIAPDCSPQLRVALGIHSFIELARRNKLFLEFTARLGRQSCSFAEVLRDSSPGFIANGIAAGVFQPLPETLALDMVESGSVAVLRRLMDGEEVDVAAFVAANLRVLGLDYETSQSLSKQNVILPTIPENSLLARGNKAWDQSH